MAAKNPELAPLAARFSSLAGGSDAPAAGAPASEEPTAEETGSGGETPKRRR
jgi:hypothetical protein